MKSVYRYRQERHFAKPLAAIWPFVSDTARLQELAGVAPFRFEERVDARGRVRRYAHGKLGPFLEHNVRHARCEVCIMTFSAVLVRPLVLAMIANEGASGLVERPVSLSTRWHWAHASCASLRPR
jgi:hypothetical protein